MSADQLQGRLALTGVIVGQLALIARDPALGYRGQAIVESLGLLSTLIQSEQATRGAFEELASSVQAMVLDGNREPTKDEWYGLRDRSAAANAVFNPPPPPEPVAEAKPE